MRTFRYLIFILLISLAAAAQTPPPSSGPQEEMLPEEAQQQDWAQKFQEAEEVFRAADQAASIPLFQDLVAKITEVRLKRPLGDPEKIILFRSLDHLGLAFYNDGQLDQSGQVFLKLIQLNPNYELDPGTVSSKIIDYYNQIKSQNLGLFTVTSDPKGATVKLDGETVGTTDLTSLYGLKGEHEIEVSKPGFFSQKQTITITPQKTAKVNVQLERSSSVGYFVTYPKGVELVMNGKVLGATSGDSVQRCMDAATLKNLPPTDCSAEFPIPDLAPGAYEIEFRKPCWESQTRRVTIDKNDDYFFEPIILEPSVAYLNITANDEKATIFVDDEYLGVAPKQKLKVCSGKHVLKLKSSRGKFEKRIEIQKNQTMDIAAKLNPSLTFLGLLSDPDVRKPDLDKLSNEVATKLSDLQNLNFVDYSGSLDAGLQQDVQAILAGINENKPDKDRIAAIQRIGTRVESDLLLIGYAQKESILRTVKFYLLSSWSSMADIRTIRVDNSDEVKTFRSQLEYEEPLFQKRLGVHLIDTEITPGPVVSAALLKTTAEGQPLTVGDILTAVNDSPVKSALEVQKTLLTLQNQDDIKMTVVRGAGTMTIQGKLVSSPMEIQFNNPTLMFNRQMQAFRKAMTISTNLLETNVARLNIGLCHMHFAEYEQAYEQFRQVELDRTVGIGPGTVAYRIAQCYRELGRDYIKDARDSLDLAAKYPQNTIFSDDGPALTREIERTRLALQ